MLSWRYHAGLRSFLGGEQSVVKVTFLQVLQSVCLTLFQPKTRMALCPSFDSILP